MERKSHLKKGAVKVREIVDSETGEVIATDSKQHTYLADTKEEFMLVYTTLLGVFNNLSLPAIKAYSYMLLNYKSGVPIEIGKTTRTIIGKHCSISEGTVANALMELKDKSLLYSPQQKVYYINPRYAFKGSSSTRNAELKAIIELGCKDC